MIRSALDLEVVSDVPRLLAIRQDWASFASSVPGITPFQSSEWLVTWWRHFGSGQPRCFVFYHHHQIVGVVPCFLHHWNGRKQLTLIGTGITDYLEPAIQPDCVDQVVSCLRSHLHSTSDWDLCDWQDLACDSPWRVLASEVAEDTQCMAVSLEGSFDQYWNNRPKSLRQNVRRDRTKAEAHGRVRFEVTTQASPELLDALIVMHRARWQKANQPGTIDANRSAEFICDVSRELASRDVLRLFSIRFEETPVAIILAFEYQGRVSNYLTAFDPDYESLGFGRTLLYEAIRYCFAQGIKVWDFLRGDEPYKTWWGAQKIPKARLRVTVQPEVIVHHAP